jgi:hypothetical protein
MEKIRRFRWELPELVATSGTNERVACDTECGDIMFVNQSNANGGAGSIYLVHQMPLPPGAAITFGANSGELTEGVIYVQGPAPVGNAGVWVFRKKYRE